MNILVLNCGSSSAKYKLIEVKSNTILAEGGVEKIGLPDAFIKMKLADGKKYVLLDFWASWCGPCRKEIPNVKKAYEQFKDKGFEVVSISIDKKEDEWRKAVKEENLVWPNFRSEEVANLFKVKAVPTVYLLDSEGKIVASNNECRGEALAAKLAELLQ